jgi:hypothetical protein
MISTFQSQYIGDNLRKNACVNRLSVFPRSFSWCCLQQTRVEILIATISNDRSTYRALKVF